ncbi:hypothetical protein B0H14DRAFT_3473066 [Mycena olivaceomarginata]|nr:hypothetical protein B0H14DRAFT_3473066 [Mycena olivaceomarginata]
MVRASYKPYLTPLALSKHLPWDPPPLPTAAYACGKVSCASAPWISSVDEHARKDRYERVKAVKAAVANLGPTTTTSTPIWDHLLMFFAFSSYFCRLP